MSTTHSPPLLEPPYAWEACRSGACTYPTAGLCPGYIQTNLAIVPHADAFDFLRFCQRNPKPCPVVYVTDPGNPEPSLVAAGADLLTDLPKYPVYRNRKLVDEPTDIGSLWREDLVGFLIGCSFTFEHDLLSAGIPVRHIEQDVNCPVYRTNRDCRPAGRFSGPLVVSMRPIPAHLVAQAVCISAARPDVHGAPVHVGAPEALGISDLDKPDWGDPVDSGPMTFRCFGVRSNPAGRRRTGCARTHDHPRTWHMFITRTTGPIGPDLGGSQR